MNSLNVAIDLDGVCFDFVGAFREFCLKHRIGDPEAVARPATQWDFFTTDWGMERDEFEDAMWVAINHADLYVRPGFIYSGVYEGFVRLKELGHTIQVVTDRSRFGPPGVAAAQTFAWLDAFDLPFDSVTFAQHKGNATSADIAIDDAEHHWRAYREAGVLCVLRDHEHNKAVEAPLRVDHFTGFVHLIEGLENSVGISTLRALYAAPQRSHA